MTRTRFQTRRLALAGLVAAVYAAATLILPIPQYMGVQFRVAEAMTVLPFLFPEAIPGLAVGCFLANLLGSPIMLDWIFGTLATLLAALLCARKGLRPEAAAAVSHAVYQQQQFDLLSEGVRQALDMGEIYRMMEEW